MHLCVKREFTLLWQLHRSKHRTQFPKERGGHSAIPPVTHIQCHIYSHLITDHAHLSSIKCACMHSLTLYKHCHGSHSLWSIILHVFARHTEPLFTVHAFLVFDPVLISWFCDFALYCLFADCLTLCLFLTMFLLKILDLSDSCLSNKVFPCNCLCHLTVYVPFYMEAAVVPDW